MGIRFFARHHSLCLKKLVELSRTQDQECGDGRCDCFGPQIVQRFPSGGSVSVLQINNQYAIKLPITYAAVTCDPPVLHNICPSQQMSTLNNCHALSLLVLCVLEEDFWRLIQLPIYLHIPVSGRWCGAHSVLFYRFFLHILCCSTGCYSLDSVHFVALAQRCRSQCLFSTMFRIQAIYCIGVAGKCC